MEEETASGSVPEPPQRLIQLTNLQYLPYLGLITGLISLTTPYIIAVWRGDVPLWLPYISDAGGDPPQSAIFSMGMSLIAVMFIMGVYLCYLIIEEQNVRNSRLIRRLGKLLIVAGLFMAVGLFGVATSPTGHLRRDGTWKVPILLPHLIGAVIFFVAGNAMMIILTYTTYLIQKPNWVNTTFIARMLIMLTGLFGALLVLYKLPLGSLDMLKPSPDHTRMYPPGTEISAIGEWVIVVAFMFFVGTFIPDFSMAKVTIKVDYDGPKAAPRTASDAQ